MTNTADLLEQKIRDEIPAIRNFPLRIQKVDTASVEVFAKLEDHVNHKGTAFGGSLYQVALVASYSLLLNILESNGFATRNFVIAKADIQYKRPVTKDFLGVAELEQNQIQNFTNRLRSGRADVFLTSIIRCQGQICATFSSKFVVLL